MTTVERPAEAIAGEIRNYLVKEQYTYEPAITTTVSLTSAQLARLERQKGIRFPAFYKEFLSMYGAEISAASLFYRIGPDLSVGIASNCGHT